VAARRLNEFYKNLEDKYGIIQDGMQLMDCHVCYDYGCVWNQHDESGRTGIFWDDVLERK
jgi:hypothetical protein